MKVLTLNPDSFLWLKKGEGLLYNAANYSVYEFPLTPSVQEICETMLDMEHLYSVPYMEESADDTLKDFVLYITSNDFGFIQDTESQSRIISFPPLLKIRHSWTDSNNEILLDSLLRNLSSFTIYTGGIGLPGNYYLQANYPSSFDSVLSPQDLMNFMKRFDIWNLRNVDIIFSNMENMDNLEGTLHFLDEFSVNIKVVLRAAELCCDRVVNLLANRKFLIEIIHTPSDNDVISEVCRTLSQTSHVFYVFSEQDYLNAIQKAQNYPNSQIRPLFNGKNHAFFHKKVLLTREDFKKTQLSRRAVFAHQVLNTNYFGKLIVLPNGKVYSNPSMPPLGNMSDPISHIVAREFKTNNAWRVIRNTKRCQKCLFQYLCPSPSFYEKQMGITCICTDMNM
ncbi:MAG: hypothetical protein NC396_00290 [Bacteroides sp.]|nr:hypothetical protein [Bacteroides sp.]MCM1084758.1 hypothetical protein [Bacteroides sp.]